MYPELHPSHISSGILSCQKYRLYSWTDITFAPLPPRSSLSL